MRAAIYSRKSKFTGKGESIENQIQLCKEYGEKLDIKEFVIYEDEGFSGGNTDRPEFQKMLKDARTKKFDTIICYRLDRISRNIADFSTLIDELQKLNIGFISIREQFDTSTPMGRAMMYIASVFAQLERETIAERIRDNMLELAKTGRWLGGVPPMGFASKRITYLDAEYKERSLVQLSPIPDELDFVKFIYNKYIQLGSVHQVHKYLLQNNIKTRNGKDYANRVISDMVRNPIYVRADDMVLEYLEKQGINTVGNATGKNGLILYNKKDKQSNIKDKSEWIAAVSKHEGIIDSGMWLEVQKSLDKNHMNIAKGSSNVALLTGLIRCKECGSSMFVTYGSKRTDGERRHYYTCSMKTNSNGSRCKNKNANGEDIERAVINTIKELTRNNGLLIDEIKAARKEVAADSNTSEIEILSKRISETESSIQNLVKQLSQNQNSAASQYILNEIEKMSKEVEYLKNKRAELSSKDKDNKLSEQNFDLIINNLTRFGELIDIADIKQKKYLISSLVDSIYWNGSTGEVEINFFGHTKKN